MDNTKEYSEIIYNENPRLLNYVDGTLETEDGHSFGIHKIVLAKCSKYFFTLFCGPGKDKNKYFIPGIRGEVLSNILLYIYTEKIRVTEENICDVIIASDYLLLDSLLCQMKTSLEENLCVTNCLDIHQWLMKMNREDFLKVSYRYIETNFEEIVSNTDSDFCELPLEFVKQFFNGKNLRVQNEKVIWQVIVRWVEADIFIRLCRVPDLLLYLRATDVDEKLAAEILTHAIVAKNTFCKVINSGSTAKYKSNLRFHQYYVWNDTQCFPFYIPRKPSSLNIIGYYCPWATIGRIEIYVTYDENIDLWRKIVEIRRLPEYFLIFGECIYLSDDRELLCYNVIKRYWIKRKYFRAKRYFYAVVSLGGFIYIIGGHLSVSYDIDIENVTFDVEMFDPVEDVWYDTQPMLPTLIYPKAVALNGFIYVVGTNTTETGMSAQMYDPSTKMWNELPGPSVVRSRFAIAAYSGKIYIVGGWNDIDLETSVEVFDPLENVWYAVESLPYYYTSHRALVFNNQLIVSENPYVDLYSTKLYPPVKWNDDKGSWETIEESSPLFKIHLYFFHIQEGDNINILSMENKKPTAVFEKSPFA